MNFKIIGYILLSAALGFGFTIFIYNVDIVLNILYKLYENEVVIYLGIVIFYFFLYQFLKRRLQFATYIIIIICVLTPILIDASVLITNPLFVPRRFPFSSIFPFIGVGLAYLKLKKQTRWFTASIITTALFLFITHQSILPQLWFNQFKKMTPKVSNKILSQKVFGIDNTEVFLGDTAFAKCILIECFFKGCSPCEQKKIVLDSLRKFFSNEDLSMIFLCNGELTSFDKFCEYANDNKKDGFVFLYDKQGTAMKVFNITGYPFEMLIKKDIIINQLTGFDNSLSEKYSIDEIKKIKEAIANKIQD